MMGAQTQLFTLITSLVILLTIFLLGPLFSFLPKVVMSSIIFVAATGLFEFEDVEFMWKIKAWKDLFLFLLTFGMTVILGVDLGIFLSIGISLFFVVKYSSLPHLGILGRVPETKKYKDIKQVAEARVIPVSSNYDLLLDRKTYLLLRVFLLSVLKKLSTLPTSK